MLDSYERTLLGLTKGTEDNELALKELLEVGNKAKQGQAIIQQPISLSQKAEYLRQLGQQLEKIVLVHPVTTNQPQLIYTPSKRRKLFSKTYVDYKLLDKQSEHQEQTQLIIATQTQNNRN